MLTVFVGQFKADPLFEAPEMTLRVSIRSVFVVTLEKKSFLVSVPFQPSPFCLIPRFLKVFVKLIDNASALL